MELPGLNPLGSMVANAVEAPMRKAQQISRVTASDPANGSTTSGRDHPEQGLAAAEARDIAALRREMQRRGLPAGPPPSFQITLLEAEGGLEQALARIEAARTQERDAPALRLDGSGTPRPGDESTAAAEKETESSPVSPSPAAPLHATAQIPSARS